MLNDASSFEKVYIACGYSDLRRGIDGLAGMIQQEFKLDPFQPGILFLFCGGKTDRIKGLLWEGDGFLLLYKRLETGKFQWPRNEEEVKAISPQQYKWLMEGIAIEQKKAIKTIAPKQVL
jgi:transposase